MHEPELPKNYPGDELLNLENWSFEFIHFFSIVTFKDIFKTPLLNKLFCIYLF